MKNAKELLSKELLSIDFSKYRDVVINGVVIFGVEIKTEEDPIGIALKGRKGRETIFRISFLKNEKIRIEELSEELVSIRVVKNRSEG